MGMTNAQNPSGGGGGVTSGYSTTENPAMTSNTTPSGVASAKDIYSTEYDAWNAFNGTTSSRWNSLTGSGTWLQYQFTAAKIIKNIMIYPFFTGRDLMLKSFKIQGSNDGSTYTDLFSATLENSSDIKEVLITLDNRTAYTYYRLLATSDSDESNTTISIYEMQMYE